MNTGLLNGLLYVPFISVLLFACILFLRTGYKKGLYRSLLSMGATVASAVLSVLLAGVFSKFISSPLANAMASMEVEGSGLDNVTMVMLIEGVISVVVALTLFSVFFFVFTIVFKIIANKYQHEMLNKEVKNDKWFGLGVRGADALIYTFLLVLPLYGTISNYVPVLSALSPQDEEVSAYIDVIASHPLTKIYDVAPTNLVYKSLSTARVGDMKVDVVETVDSVNELYSMFMKLEATDDASKGQVIGEIADYIDKDVINQKWFYDLAVSSVSELKNQVSTLELNPKEKQVVEDFFNVCNVSHSEFKESGKAVIDFVKTAVDIAYGPNADKTPEDNPEFIKSFGKLLNSTPKVIELKNVAYKYFMYECLDEKDYAKADAIVAKIASSNAADESQYTNDALFFIGMAESIGKDDLVKVLKTHPSLTQNDIKEFMK